MKIVVPIMPTSLEEAQALELSRFEGADIIEWRADFLDKHSILTVAPAIFEKFAGFEIVFTIRTTREGGKIELTDGEYVTLIKDVAAIYSPDYIDFEYFTRKEVFDQMLEFSNFKAFNPEQEFVTMSMGKLGRLSRLAGDLVGSSWTFASLDNTSAPGQVALADMCRIREVLDAD